MPAAFSACLYVLLSSACTFGLISCFSVALPAVLPAVVACACALCYYCLPASPYLVFWLGWLGWLGWCATAFR